MKVKGRNNKIINQVDDAFNYFSFRLEELKKDDVYYIRALMHYIDILESQLNKNNK